jgi:hypothetical protein
MEKQFECGPHGDLGEVRVLQKLAFESRQWKAGWMRSVDAARIVWNRLSYDELLQTHGDAQNLAGLIEKRYRLGEGEASRQVEEFLGQCGTWS